MKNIFSEEKTGSYKNYKWENLTDLDFKETMNGEDIWDWKNSDNILFFMSI